MDQYQIAEIYDSFRTLIHNLKIARSEYRTPKDRIIAITITEVEKAAGFFVTMMNDDQREKIEDIKEN